MGIEHPEWLPEGWKVQVKVRSSGKKDRYYVDLSSGRSFNSKSRVFEYLETRGKVRKAKDPSPKPKVSVEKTVAENLPPGWIKEIRTKTMHGRIRRDRYYIDPDSGCHFRSMKEVSRYLESRDPRKAKAKQDGAKSLPAEAKGQRLMDKKSVKSGSSSGEDDYLASLFSDNPELMNRVKRRGYRFRGDKKLGNDGSDKSADKHQSPKSGEDNAGTPVATTVSEQKVKTGDSAPPLVKAKEQCYHRRRHSKRLADIKQKDDADEGSEDLSENILNAPETGGSKHIEDVNNVPETGGGSKHTEDEKHSAGIQPNKNPTDQSERKYTKRKSASDLPSRNSNRLAHMEVDLSKKVKMGKEDGADNSKAEVHDDCQKCSQENPAEDSSGEQKSVGSNEKHPESTLKDLLMDPCIEFAIKTLTGAIPIEDLTKASRNSPVSSLASPSQTPASSSKLPPTVGIWTDPCFEFAVKTLTSDGTEQDGSHFQITFQPKLGADNLYSLNHPSTQFDAVKRRLV